MVNGWRHGFFQRPLIQSSQCPVCPVKLRRNAHTKPYICRVNAPTLIASSEALDIILARTSPLGTESLPVVEAGGRILAEPVDAPVDMPPFDNSAMDGFALAFSPGDSGPWKIVGGIAAGDTGHHSVGRGECVRIFTGAPIPPGADTVIQREWTREMDGLLYLEGGPVRQGDHIRPRASQIGRGERALASGTLLTPGAVGFLANLGIPAIRVGRWPRVGILVTGSELVPPGQPLGPGQIYESNSHSLVAALAGMGIQPEWVERVTDDIPAFTRILDQRREGLDVLLVTGGISAGDHDIFRLYIEAGRVEPYFYKVRQRPGKPLFCGREGQTLVFGLPGNPASVLSCFYLYVYPALRRMGGFRELEMERRVLPLAQPFTKKTGMVFFLKAKILDGEVMPLEGQLSYIMRSFAEADALIVLDEDKSEFPAGDLVEVRLLPQGQP